ncbi:MAG: hypothetical protein WAS27_04245 [Candidatus Saccharimonadales bacterium]
MIASLLLIAVVGALVVTHYYNVSKIDRLTKVNPTLSAQSDLISQDLLSNPEIASSAADFSPEPDANEGTSPQANDVRPSSTGVATPPVTSAPVKSQQPVQTTTPSPNTSEPVTPPAAPFTASIGTVTNSVKKTCLIVFVCSEDNTFTGIISVENGPGTVQYRWERSTGSIGAIESKVVPAGVSSFIVNHTWKDRSSGWVKLRITAPNQAETTYKL